MTEKKYMTASEYFRNEIPLRVKIYMDEFNKSKLVLEELDTHFINKEELKDKINSGLNDINTNETILKLRKGKAKEYWSGVIRGLNDCLKLLELLKE